MDRKTSWIQSSLMPCARSTRRPYRVLPQDSTSVSTCRFIKSWLVMVIPRALMLVTRWMFSKVGGCTVDVPRLPRALKIISNVLFWFNLRLLSDAHWLMLSSSGWQEWTMRCVSSAYLMISLTIVTGRGSPVSTTYEAGVETNRRLSAAYTCTRAIKCYIPSVRLSRCLWRTRDQNAVVTSNLLETYCRTRVTGIEWQSDVNS